MHKNEESTPLPRGSLGLQTLAMPRDANPNGDIFGGWLVSQMDLAGGVAARQRAQGRVATVAIDSMVFLRPLQVGDVVGFYTEVLSLGRSSIKIMIEVWKTDTDSGDYTKITEGLFTFVAIDDQGRTRPLGQ